MTQKLRIVQLQPRALGLTGDRGNTLVLARRLELGGVPVEVLEVDGDAAVPSSADLVVVGNGSRSAVRSVIADLVAAADRLADWVAAGVPLLAVGAGMEALGSRIRDADGSVLDGARVLPLSVDRDGPRRVGYLGVRTAFGGVIGFEDHRGHTTLEAGAEPFGTVDLGVTGSKGHSDGIRFGNAIGTRVQGPVLPLNPALADALISLALARFDREWAPGDAHAELDNRAAKARAVILEHIDHHFSSI